jgi:hypothetical protein
VPQFDFTPFLSRGESSSPHHHGASFHQILTPQHKITPWGLEEGDDEKAVAKVIV